MQTATFEPDVSNGQALSLYSSSVNIQTDPGVAILATFGSGRAAITQKDYYAGKAIYFAFNPLTKYMLRSPLYLTGILPLNSQSKYEETRP